MSKSYQMWNLSGIISFGTISVPFSLSSPSGTLIMLQAVSVNIIPLFRPVLSHCFHSFFLFVL